MYETPSTGLFQSKILISGLELASIESLKNEIKEQYGIMVFNEDEDYIEEEVETGEKIVELIGKASLHELLICKEGAFYWDDFDCEYEYAGTLNEQNIKRVIRLDVPEDKAMLIGDEITVIKSRIYNIQQEKVQTIDSDTKIEMFTIQLLSGQTVTIPNSPGIYRLYEADIALIDYIEK